MNKFFILPLLVTSFSAFADVTIFNMSHSNSLPVDKLLVTYHTDNQDDKNKLTRSSSNSTDIQIKHGSFVTISAPSSPYPVPPVELIIDKAVGLDQNEVLYSKNSFSTCKVPFSDKMNSIIILNDMNHSPLIACILPAL